MSSSAFTPITTQVTTEVPVNVPVVTAWEPVSLTFTNGGSISSSEFFRRRVGDNMEIRGGVIFSGAGAGSTLILNMPTGFTIDLTKSVEGTGAQGGFLGVSSWYDISSANAMVDLKPWALNSTSIGFALLNTISNLFGSSLANGDYFTVNLSIPISQWAGSGTTTLAERALEEYAWNSSPGTGNDTTSFANGPDGVNFRAFPVSITIKRVRFLSPILPTDRIVLEIQLGGSFWFPIEATNNYASVYVEQNTLNYGTRLDPVNSTDVDVIFGSYRKPSGANYASPGAAWSDLTSFKWRVRKVSSGAQVGYPISTKNIVGATDGVAPVTGMLGERISASPASTVSFGASAVSTQVASLTLSPGTWLVSGMVRMSISGTGLAYFAAISSSSNSIDSASFLSGASATVTGATYVATPVRYVTVSQNTPYYLIGTINYSSLPGGGYLTDSIIQAIRIA